MRLSKLKLMSFKSQLIIRGKSRGLKVIDIAMFSSNTLLSMPSTDL